MSNLLTRVFAALALVLWTGVARGSSPAEDDPGMMDGYRRMLADEQRWLIEQEARRQKGEGSILQTVSGQASNAAQNDFVTGLVGQGIEAGATRVLGQAAGKVVGNLPVDDIAKVAGHASEGDVEGAAEAYATGFVGLLSGAIAGLGVESAIAGTTLVVTSPGWAAALPVAAGIGAAYLAKRGFEALLDYGRAQGATPRTPRPTRGTTAIAASPASALPGPSVAPGVGSGTAQAQPPPVVEPKQATPPVVKPQPLAPVPSPPTRPASSVGAVPAVKSAPVKGTTPAPKAGGQPFVVYCLCCKHELTLPRGQKPPSACPSCGRAKARIYETNENGQKCLLGGSSSWYWPKGAKTGLKDGQWFE